MFLYILERERKRERKRKRETSMRGKKTNKTPSSSCLLRSPCWGSSLKTRQWLDPESTQRCSTNQTIPARAININLSSTLNPVKCGKYLNHSVSDSLCAQWQYLILGFCLCRFNVTMSKDLASRWDLNIHKPFTFNKVIFEVWWPRFYYMFCLILLNIGKWCHLSFLSCKIGIE